MMRRLRAATVFLAAAVVIVGGWRLARLPADSPQQDARLAQRFAFHKVALNEAAGPRSVRPVAPAYEKINHWISSVGAAIALGDLDGNGRSDDVCLVDPRTDTVTIRPVPGTGERYDVRTLSPAGSLPYEPTMAPMGCVPGDFDEDGRTDALVYYWGRSPVLFLRDSAGTGFTARELVTPYQVWNTDAVSLADVDGDGHTDIIVGNYFPDGARVLDPTAHQDELQMQRSMSAAYNGGVDRILLATGSGGYTEVPGVLDGDVAKGWTLAIGAQDLDGDGRPELYFANDFGPDRLLRNLSTPGHVRLQLTAGVRHLTTPKSKVLGNDSFKGMGVAFPDLNRDGVPDIVVSNITENYALQESNFAWISTRDHVLGGDGTAYYDDRSEPLGISRSGWGWDIKTGDFAGDGDTQIMQATGFVDGTVNRWAQLQELAMTNDDLLANPANWPQVEPGDDVSGKDPNPFFVRAEDGRFHDVSRLLGVADPGPSRGIALGDVDHDGRLDFAVANQWRQSYAYRNVRAAERPYLGLTLQHPTGTPAIGAAVTIRESAAGISSGQLYPANGHGGVSASELLFSLAAARAVPVSVTWRDMSGSRHTAEAALAPGWHRLVLQANGTIQEVTS